MFVPTTFDSINRLIQLTEMKNCIEERSVPKNIDLIERDSINRLIQLTDMKNCIEERSVPKNIDLIMRDQIMRLQLYNENA